MLHWKAPVHFTFLVSKMPQYSCCLTHADPTCALAPCRCTSGNLPELKNMPLLKDELLQQATLQQEQ